MRVTLAHVRSVPGFGPRPGFCSRGTRAWFARHGLSWSAFVREGVDAAVLEATGDAFALAVVAHARAQEAARG